MKLLFLALLFLAASCTNGESTKGEDKSYQAITDSSNLTRDSLNIPDSTTPSLTH